MELDYSVSHTLGIGLSVLAIWALFLVRLVRGFATGRFWTIGETVLRAEQPVDYWAQVAIEAACVCVWGGVMVAWMVDRGPAFDDRLFIATMGFLSLVLLVRLVQMIATGTSGASWAVGGVHSRSERPVDFWVEVALIALFFWAACWSVVDKVTAGDGRPGSPALRLMIALCAVYAVRLLVQGFVSADNRYVPRAERTGFYWPTVIFLCAVVLLGTLAFARWG